MKRRMLSFFQPMMTPKDIPAPRLGCMGHWGIGTPGSADPGLYACTRSGVLARFFSDRLQHVEPAKKENGATMHACELKLLKYRTDPNALEISLPYGGITFADSTNGAVAVISTKKSSGTYDYVILDNATVMRGDADTIQSYVNTFDDLPDHMNLRSAPETLSVYRDWQSLWDVTSKAQDGAVVLIPGTSIYNGLWLDCFENYQNPVRLDSIVDGGVASLQI